MFQANACSCFSVSSPLQEQVLLPVTPINRCVHKKALRLACLRRSASATFQSASSITGIPKTWLRLYQICPGRPSVRCRSMANSADHTAGLTAFTSDLRNKLDAFYRFSRPHTIYGTIIGITSVSLLPLQSLAELSPAFLVGLLKALIPSLAMNIYIVGLNQLFDVEIDKVNKPDLPIASGEFSMGLGITLVSIFLLMSFTMGIMFQSPPLFSALAISFILGSAYSVELPLLRWKKHAFLAALSILIVRAIVVQFAFFLHIQKYVLGRPVLFTKPLLFATGFMCVFTAVIALFKDIPDVDGDRNFGIRSFSVRLGQERVFWLCISMMLTAYGAAAAIGASSSFLPTRLITVLGHFSLACFLLYRARAIDLTSKASVTSFYMLIWKLFYAEYFLIPFVH